MRFQKEEGGAPGDFKLQIQGCRMGELFARMERLQHKRLCRLRKDLRLISNLNAGSCLTSRVASPMMQKRGTSCSAAVSPK